MRDEQTNKQITRGDRAVHLYWILEFRNSYVPEEDSKGHFDYDYFCDYDLTIIPRDSAKMISSSLSNV